MGQEHRELLAKLGAGSVDASGVCLDRPTRNSEEQALGDEIESRCLVTPPFPKHFVSTEKMGMHLPLWLPLTRSASSILSPRTRARTWHERVGLLVQWPVAHGGREARAFPCGEPTQLPLRLVVRAKTVLGHGRPSMNFLCSA